MLGDFLVLMVSVNCKMCGCHARLSVSVLTLLSLQFPVRQTLKRRCLDSIDAVGIVTLGFDRWCKTMFGIFVCLPYNILLVVVDSRL